MTERDRWHAHLPDFIPPMKQGLGIGLAIVLGAGSVLYFMGFDIRSPRDESPTSPAFSPPSAPTVQPALKSNGASTSDRRIRPALTVRKTNDWIKEASDSADCRDLLAAHKAVQLCKSREDMRRRNPALDISDTEVRLGEGRFVDCSALTAEQRRDHLQWLERAVEQQVPGAALEWLTAGPNGQIDDLEMRNDDPLVRAWSEKAIRLLDAAARRGDVEAIGALSGVYSSDYVTERDMTKSVMYDVVIFKLLRQKGGNGLVGYQRLMDRYRREMSPEKWQAVEESAEAFFQSCCAKPRN